MKMAERMQRLGTEKAFEVLAEVVNLKEEGKDIINFAIGEPDFPTPDNIKEAGIKAIQENKTHYTPSAGLPEVKRAVRDYIKETRGVQIKEEEVVIMPGSKPFLYHGLLALAEKGDQVLYPSPGYPIYSSVISFAGAEPVPYPLSEEKDFQLMAHDVEARLTEKTRGIIINAPHNPTGAIVGRKSMAELVDLLKEKDLFILTDEIYSRIIYDEEFVSILSFPGMKEKTLLIDGLSKTYAMTGWRIGFGVCPGELAQALTQMEINSEACTANFTQLAAKEALLGPQDQVEVMVNAFKERRDLMVEGLNRIDGISCRVPGGAFYVFPNVSQLCQRLGIKNATHLQEYLLHELGVAVLSRECFGAKLPGEEEFLRLSYATSQELIQEGLKRLEQL